MAKQSSLETNVESNDIAQNLQAQLADNMMGLFDVVVSDRGSYFAQNPDTAFPFIIKYNSSIW